MVADYACGFSFRIGQHLWMVVVQLPQTGDLIIVNLTTRRQNSDTTVVFDEGDHSFIKHSSVIGFAYARIFNKQELMERIAQKDFEVYEPFEEEKANQVQDGLLLSPHTPNGIKSLCRELFKKKLLSAEK